MNPHKRRLVAGDAGIAGGVNWRIREGHKFVGDLVIEWYIGERWVPVKLEALFVPVDLICQNEDERYPYPREGGQRVIRFLQDARRCGYEYAAGRLNLERANREERDRREWEGS